jgi:AsmA family protein
MGFPRRGFHWLQLHQMPPAAAAGIHQGPRCMMSIRTNAIRLAIIAVSSVGVVVLVLVFFPWNTLRGPVAQYFSHQLGRPVTIGGDLDVMLGWTPRIQVDDVTIGNAPWSKDPQMAHVQRMSVRVKLLSLFFGTTVFPAIELVEPQLLLEKNKEGLGNWVFGDGSRGPPAVRFGTVNVDRGLVHYRDPALRADINVKVQSSAAASDTTASLGFTGDGILRDEPFHIDGKGQGLSALRNVDDPYPLALHAHAGATDLRFAGSVVPSEVENLKGELQLQGKDLSQLYPFVPLPIPWTPPYKLAGHLTHGDAIWSYRQFMGTVGDSDLAGDAAVDLSQARPLVTADLSSRRFDYKDLGGIVGLPPGESTSATKTPEQQRATARRAVSTRVLPDKPFELARLRIVDADIKFRGTSVTWTDAPIDNLSTHAVLKDGVLRFQPVDFGIGGGHVIGNMSLDANGETARSQGDIEIRNVELKRIFPKLASPQGSAGRFGGRASFKTQGSTIAAMAASADGEAAMLMRGGEASTLALVMTNLDLARAFMLVVGGDQTSQIHCAVGSFKIAAGRMTPDILVIDTSAVTIRGEGGVDFRDEKYNLLLKASSKKASMLALRGPILIGGTFKHPTVAPEPGALTTRLGAAAGLGAVAPPLALLALVDPGGAPDVDCGQVIADTKTPRAARALKAPPPQPDIAANAR